MPRLHVVLVALSVALGLLYALAVLRNELGGPAGLAPVVIVDSTRHLVTPAMADASREMVERKAPGFHARAADGRAYSLAELRAAGPVLLTFIKQGCPCSESAQPYFNALHAAYPGVSLLGVIDVEGEAAGRWAERHRVTDPMLLDPAGELVRGYGVQNSAYVVLVDSEGRIARHWPGYSAPMLRELGATLAAMTGRAEVPLALDDAPEELYTGCPYDF